MYTDARRAAGRPIFSELSVIAPGPGPGAWRLRRWLRPVTGWALGWLVAALAGAGPASAGTFTVTGTGDSSSPDGKCTLREALYSAAHSALPDCPGSVLGAKIIVFNIPGAGIHTITTSGLTVEEPVLIDGYSQPDATTNNLASGSNARLLVELVGNVGIPAACLTLGSGAAGSSVRGLVIRGCVTLKVEESGGHTITGNFIGTNAAGTAAGPGNSGPGIEITSFYAPISGITIGGLAPADRNVISGNGGAGILPRPGGGASSGCWTG